MYSSRSCLTPHISTGEEIDAKKDKEKDIIPKDGPKDAAIKDTSKEPIEAVKEAAGRRSTPEPRFDPEKYEPVVKTPPEPTRVKSPDQVGKWVCFLLTNIPLFTLQNRNLNAS